MSNLEKGIYPTIFNITGYASFNHSDCKNRNALIPTICKSCLSYMNVIKLDNHFQVNTISEIISHTLWYQRLNHCKIVLETTQVVKGMPKDVKNIPCIVHPCFACKEDVE